MPATAPEHLEPSLLFLTYNRHESEFRSTSTRLGAGAEAPEMAAQEVRRSAVFLELALLAAIVLEQNEREPAERTPQQLAQRISVVAGISVAATMRAFLIEFGPDSLGHATAGGSPPTLQMFVRLIESMLAVCRIGQIELLAGQVGLQDWGHRCRRAYDLLRAFVVRNGEQAQPQLNLVGRGYAEGVFTPDEVAVLLNVHPSDAMALLQDRGYFRPIEAIILGDDERRTRLQKIREDRLRRSGNPASSPDYVLRDVLASERIEGVDARPWLRQ